jgi:hypothetical protein
MSPEILEVLVGLRKELAELRSEVAELRNQREKVAGRWVGLGEAADILGLSAWQMRDKIRSGEWRHGKEFINTSNGTRPSYKVNPDEVMKAVALPPEKRKGRR